METLEFEQLTAGDRPLTQNTGAFAASQTLTARSPVGRITATGELKKWDPAANDGSERALFLTVGVVDTATGAKSAPYFDGGHFNEAIISWPEGITAAQKLAAFDGTPIAIGNVLS
ncbi:MULTISPECIES: head decoration protein [Pseudoalteromonas]|uniref:head decoration protein n=1 Tax=Pseudoalteromonas TaxID=53246 RepID=UPI0005FA873B|nr:MULTISPECIES: head decoration protein [Pseudoalteromonas]KJZ03281.1 hypothetical protein TW73_09040 [Pseudoalteromonas piscicida]TMN34134.1 head decoration protein [Pseudoalteromonas sp. S2755]